MRKRSNQHVGGSIFKDKTKRYQGEVSRVGSIAFEQARKRLALMAGRRTASDGDVFECLARGWEETAEYLTTLDRG